MDNSPSEQAATSLFPEIEPEKPKEEAPDLTPRPYHRTPEMHLREGSLVAATAGFPHACSIHNGTAARMRHGATHTATPSPSGSPSARADGMSLITNRRRKRHNRLKHSRRQLPFPLWTIANLRFRFGDGAFCRAFLFRRLFLLGGFRLADFLRHSPEVEQGELHDEPDAGAAQGSTS